MYGLLVADERHFRIERDAEVFIIHFFGHWDAETTRAYMRRLQWLIEFSGLATWGALVDFREWEGATPEAMDMLVKTAEWMMDNGQIAGAHVLNSGVLSQQLGDIQQRRTMRIPFATFLAVEIALPWVWGNVRHVKPLCV